MNEFSAIQNDQTPIDDEGWALIAPFGEHPKTRVYREGGQVKEQRFIQVLDKESADALLDGENSFFRKLKRALIGIPIYKGHGDLNEHDPKALGNDTPKIKLGVVDKIRKAEPRPGRSGGIEAHFALDNDGAEAVAAGWKLPSAFWLVMPIGNEVRADGQQAIRARPFKLLSVALTQFPNISGVESLANQRDAGPIDQNQTTPPGEDTGPTRQPAPGENTGPTNATSNPNDTMLTEKITGWLTGRGITLPNNANETDLFNALVNDAAEGEAGESTGDAARCSKKAHLASARAHSRATHTAAAVAHSIAADANDEAGNAEATAMHGTMARFHLRQGGQG